MSCDRGEVQPGLCLVGEDDQILCALLETMLERAGWTVRSFTCVEEGLAELHKLGEGPSDLRLRGPLETGSALAGQKAGLRLVLLVDLNLPLSLTGCPAEHSSAPGGLTLVRRARELLAEQGQQAGLVLMSGDQLAHVPSDTTFLPKPFRRSQLLETVARACPALPFLGGIEGNGASERVEPFHPLP
ncbi:DNA-binding transcriptional response regulator [Oecophyllibacter saccharovorans]|uniref:hypothetical protein n=1 Tax=Oecophyllibacter saccharovorans TaxID=2558360 RepID=UPI001170198D|nr:hypothetical protein [Oecophyllibacter saccharovorans]TPW35108.1 response regulator [Oecophyllibacter saccharovorans]